MVPINRPADNRHPVLPRYHRYEADISADRRVFSLESRARYIDSWSRWEQAAPADQVEQRRTAVAILHDCLDRNALELDLIGVGLAELPDLLPDGIERLAIQNNRLTRLPDHFPDSLLQLEASDNLITTLPDTLPTRLEELDVSDNRLTVLPSTLPAGLRNLSVAGNLLSALPNDLPPGLRNLFAYRNTLVALPERLPDGLVWLGLSNNQLLALPTLPDAVRLLDVEHNQLTALPDRLPSALRMLNARNNRLNTLPGDLPASLRELIVSENSLTHLPSNLPPSLELLEACTNQLSSLPQSVYELPGHARVVISGNVFSDPTTRRLRALAEDASDYRGPNIEFSIFEARDGEPARRLQDVVVELMGEPAEASTHAQWTAISDEPHAPVFGEFLDRLAKTVGATDPAFQHRVACWLQDLADRPSLRQQTFLIAQDATETCEDRVTLTFNEMQVAALADRVDHGEYDGRLVSLIRTGREMFRLETLQKIAREKVARSRVVDEIEVYLAFQTGLRDTLQLETAAQRMRYADASGVDANDLQQALARVRECEAAEFADWLVGWMPWQNMIHRLAPARSLAMTPEDAAARQDEHARRVGQLLAKSQLRGIADAEAAIGGRVWEEMRRESDKALTETFFLDLFPRAAAPDAATRCLQSVETLVDIACIAPALTAIAINARDSRGNHLGSSIAEIVTDESATPLADAYFSLLRILHSEGSVGTDDVLHLVLPRRNRDTVASPAHAIAGAAWSSQATASLCSLLTELAAANASAPQKLIKLLSLKQGGYDFKTNVLNGEIDFFKRAKRANLTNPNPKAVALLRVRGLIPDNRALSAHRSQSDATVIPRESSYDALLGKIRQEFQPRLFTSVESRARERKDLNDASQSAALLLRQQEHERRARARLRTGTAELCAVATRAAGLASHDASSGEKRAIAEGNRTLRHRCRQRTFGAVPSQSPAPWTAVEARREQPGGRTLPGLTVPRPQGPAARDGAATRAAPHADEMPSPESEAEIRMRLERLRDHDTDEDIRRRLDMLRGHGTDESLRRRLLTLRGDRNAESTAPRRQRGARAQLAPALPRD